MTTLERDRAPADDREQLRREIANSNSLILFKLPVELRNEIWRLTVPEIVSLDADVRYNWKILPISKSKYLHGRPSDWATDDLSIAGQMKLLRICQRMKREISSIFLCETTFLLGQNLRSGYLFRRTIGFVSAIDSNAANLLRHVVLRDYAFYRIADRQVRLDLKLRVARLVLVWSLFEEFSQAEERDFEKRQQSSPYPCEAAIKYVLHSVTLESEAWFDSSLFVMEQRSGLSALQCYANILKFQSGCTLLPISTLHTLSS